jgi:hemolysin activation/secretion protein
MPGNFNKRQLTAVLGALLFCLGAAEFPAFRMEEFDRAVQDEQLFEGETPETIDVPRVAERAYGLEEQQLLPVTGVVIEGVIPHPEQNITQEEVQAIIDRQLREEQNTLKDENGFTERQMNEMGRFLREMIDRGGWDEEDLQNLVKLIQEYEFKDYWISVEQLDAIALAVTEHYRENGFILATAFIPEQEVKDGVIRMNVLEGRLGDVTVSNNQIFEPQTIAAAFNSELGEPVTEERIESALRRINDLPGLRVRGSFSPGQNVGETRLNLGVLEEQDWASSLLLDNHGSATTGEVRLFATTEWRNLLNKGHRLLIGVLQSEGPDSSTYGLAEYELPVTDDGRGRVRGTISTNTFAVASLGTQQLNIVGETNNFGVSGSYQLVRSRTFNVGAEVGYTFKDVLFDVEGAPTLSRDEKIETVSAAVNYNQLFDEQLLLISGRLGIDQGYMNQGAQRDQSIDFTKTLFALNVLKRFSVPNWITKDESFFNFVFKVNGQYSEKFLSSVEQFSLGGPNAVRAFSVSDVSVDSGAYAGFELFFDAPFDVTSKFQLPLEPLKPFLFYDYAYGVARTAAGDGRDGVVKGYGLGLRIVWPGQGVANLIFAEPRSANFDDNFSQVEGESRIYFDLQYQVR